MPTLRGMRRRGVPPEAIRRFWSEVGVAKRDNNIEVSRLEYCIRDHLNKVAPRVMGVLRPLKVVITNYPEGEGEQLEAVNNPEDESAGTRPIPFGRELWIEADDFMEDPPRRFFRLAPGREVRLRYAYFITCEEVVKDAEGRVVELRCTYDPATRGGDAPDGRKVKATPALGLGGPRHRGRGAALRPALPGGGPPRRGRRRGLDGQPEPRVAGGPAPLLAGAGPGRVRPGDDGAVRAAGLLLRRPGLHPGQTGLQPHRDPPRRLGQHQEAGRLSRSRAPVHSFSSRRALFFESPPRTSIASRIRARVRSASRRTIDS